MTGYYRSSSVADRVYIDRIYANPELDRVCQSNAVPQWEKCIKEIKKKGKWYRVDKLESIAREVRRA